MRCLDEAAAAAFAGEAQEPWVVNWCCCYVIYACERVRDYDRASQWCRRAVEYAERNGMESFNRLCRAHYAGVLVWRGLWREAESELVAARDLLEATRPPWAAEAVVRLAELRRRQGRLDEAEELLGQAEGHPLAAVGRAELALDRGEPAAAVDCLERFLRDVPERGRTQRALALDALVRARLGLGDREAARAALSELRGHAEAVPGDALWGAVALAAGELEWAEGAADAARRSFEDALARYTRAGAPYEVGRARLRVAEALAALGREVQAAGEADAAARALGKVGAARDAARAQALAGRLSARPPKPAITAREREVLAMVAAGRSDRAIAEALVLSEHTVHRHVANIMAKLGSASRSAAVAEALRRELL
jgi:ATP/maltotriose-dependent transcriptional regulator MalT